MINSTASLGFRKQLGSYMFENTYTEISGTFVRICSPDQVNLALKRNSPTRPEARYNRLGQDALYLAVDEESARVAMQKYAKDIYPLPFKMQSSASCEVSRF